MSHCPRLRAAIAVLFMLTFAFVAEAGVASRVSDETLAPLSRPIKAGGRVTLRNVPLVDGKQETLELEEFSVLAPDAVIEIHREDGTVDHVKPQPMRQFRGRVAGTPESLVYISVGGHVDGLIFMHDRKFSMKTDKHGRGKAADRDVLIEEIPIHEDIDSLTGFECGVEGTMISPDTETRLASLSTRGPVANAYSWPTSTATTMINLGIDTDSAMYSNLGGNTTTIENYVRNLIGAASTIYHRDLRADLRITLLSIWTAGDGADPFVVNPGSTSGTWNGVPGTAHTHEHALAEYGDWWHANRASVKRSAAMLLSGQTANTGVGWIQTLCSNGGTCSAGNCDPPDRAVKIYDGHRWGSYTYNTRIAIGGGTVVPDPDSGVNYVMPSSNYWELYQLSHELGHNVQANHTHCTDTDLVTAGMQPIDTCVGGCVAQGAIPAVKGTIMSYCHLRVGGATNTRYTFGQPGELSEVMINNMRNRLDVITPTGLSSITAPASLAIGAAGIASVTNTAGLTYDWTIVNGTINSGQGTSSINFTATADPVSLRVTATNAVGCGISDSREVEGEAVSFDPPINVIATAVGSTSVDVSWAAVIGATHYQVYRAQQHGSFGTLVGTTTSTTLTDNTAAANTAYQYVVTAGDGGANWSTFSDDDMAVTVVYTDPTLTAQSTRTKVSHFNELLTAVNAVNTLIGSSTIGFNVPAPSTTTTVRREHVIQLRFALDDARVVLGYPAISYTDQSITAQSTTIKTAHVTELRDGMR